MEVVKKREKTDYLRRLSSLDKRHGLSHEDKQSLINLEKGFEGETIVDEWMEQSKDVLGLVLNDLLLTIKGNTVQIDSLIIAAGTIYIYEVKNYEGNYLNKNGQLFTFSGKEINSPLTQLNRTASLIRQLLAQWKVEMPVKAAVVFVNPKFVLYEAKAEDPFIFSQQLKQHFSELNHERKLLSKQHRYLAERLLKENVEEASFQKRFPEYNFAQLKKGLTCPKCASFNIKLTERSCSCNKCKNRTTIVDTVLSQVEEFKLLFPEMKVTVPVIHEWSGGVLSKYQIRKILIDNFEKKGQGHGTYYI